MPFPKGKLLLIDRQKIEEELGGFDHWINALDIPDSLKQANYSIIVFCPLNESRIITVIPEPGETKTTLKEKFRLQNCDLSNEVLEEYFYEDHTPH